MQLKHFWSRNQNAIIHFMTELFEATIASC